MTKLPICVLLQLTHLTSSALAIVTSDDPANHRVVPGVTAYGLNLDGVAVIGSGDPDATSSEAARGQSNFLVVCGARETVRPRR
jgi:hypothetical protein